MRLETLKQAVSDKFKIDLDNSSRKRKYVYAKKVFCKLARETGATFKEIAEEIKMSESSVTHHIRYLLDCGLVVEELQKGAKGRLKKVPILKIKRVVIKL